MKARHIIALVALLFANGVMAQAVGVDWESLSDTQQTVLYAFSDDWDT